MDRIDELDSETRRTGEEIRKAEMRREIGDLKEEIDRKGREISRGLENTPAAPSATADEE